MLSQIDWAIRTIAPTVTPLGCTWMRSALSLGVLLALAAAGLAGAAEREQASLQLQYVPQPALEATSGAVAVSPTGRNLYVLGGLDNRTRLAVFGRDPQTGRLWRPAGPARCFRAWYVHAGDCGSAPGLNNSFAIAVSPDARDVAIGAYAAAQLALLRRESSGALHYGSCLGEPVGTFRCGVIRGLDGVEDVAFSPDGRNLYIAARQDNPGLLVLGRNRATGAVQQLRGESGCLQRDGRKQPETPPCAVVPAAWYAPRLVRVTADGRTVVTNSRTNRDGDGIFVFRRNAATGALTPLACYLVVAKPPCEPYPATRGVADLVIARDSRTVIVANGDSTLSVLSLDGATGRLTRRHCLSTAGGADCTRARVPSYATLVLTPDGRRLFALGPNVIRSYAFTTNGSLLPIAGRGACAAAYPVAGCTTVRGRLGSGEFRGPLEVSPDGRWLYANALAFRIVG